MFRYLQIRGCMARRRCATGRPRYSSSSRSPAKRNGSPTLRIAVLAQDSVNEVPELLEGTEVEEPGTLSLFGLGIGPALSLSDADGVRRENNPLFRMGLRVAAQRLLCSRRPFCVLDLTSKCVPLFGDLKISGLVGVVERSQSPSLAGLKLADTNPLRQWQARVLLEIERSHRSVPRSEFGLDITVLTFARRYCG
jgi:hypothetical protein